MFVCIEYRYFLQVKENHEKMQREREAKRKQAQAKKEAEAQARLVVLKVNDYFFLHHRMLNSFYRKNVNEL